MTSVMATKMDFKSTKDSEENFDVCCSPCSEAGSTKEGKHFCEDCGSYFCEQCLKDHNKFPALRSHKIATVHGDGTTAVRGPTERCGIHCGQIIDRYCKDHDEVCCEVCVTIKHRSCTSVDQIENVAKGITGMAEFTETKDYLKEVISSTKQEKDKRNKNVLNLNEKKETILQAIDKYQEDIINRIKVLAESSRNDVITKHAELVRETQSDIKELDTVLMLSEESSRKVNATGVNEAQVFTNVKNSKKTAADVKKIVDDLSSNWTEKNLGYYLNNEPKGMVSGLKSFGSFSDEIDNSPYLAASCKKINVKVKDDSQTCDINSICTLDDGTFIISDFRNKKIKRLGKNFEVANSFSLDGGPMSVCATRQDEVAVALREQRRVQFVTCGNTFSLGHSFNTDLRCIGLYFDSKHAVLYVSCGGKWIKEQSKVIVYRYNGTQVRTIQTSTDDISLFSSPVGIVMATSTEEVYIADRENGLIAINRSGKKLWTFTNQKLKSPWGICTLPGNQLLVTGHDSGNILQVGADGTEVCELLGSSEGLVNPYTVIYDKENSRIIIGCQGDEIRVYTMFRKMA